MILGRVVILSLLMVCCISATPLASQQDAALLSMRLRAIQQIPSPIRLSNGELIHTTTVRGQLEALEALTTGSTEDRWQLADVYYLFAWRMAGGNREGAQTMFQNLTGHVSIREANRLFEQCAKRAPAVAATETAKSLQAAQAAKAAEAARAAQAAQARAEKEQAEQAAKAQVLQAAAQSWQATRQQFPQGWHLSCLPIWSRPVNWIYCYATRGELRVTLYGPTFEKNIYPPRVSIDMGKYAEATALWFDDDPQRWTMRIPYSIHEGHDGRPGRFVTPPSATPVVIERMLTASVLRYTYTSSQLPLGENTNISVTGFSQVWEGLQELFRRQMNLHKQ